MVDNKIYPSRDFSDNDLKMSALITSHFSTFKSIGVVSLIIMDIIFIGLFFRGIYIYAMTYEATERAIASNSILEIDWPSVRLAIAPKILLSESVNIIPAGSTSDFVSRIRNQNEKRWGEFEYRFVWAGDQTEWNSTFILPGSSKYVLALGIEESTPTTVRLEIQNLKWRTLDSEDKERFEITKNSVTVVNSVFTPNVNREIEGIPISGVEFLVENRSPFGFQNIPFTILLTNGNTFTAVNRATLSKLGQGEEKLVRVRWFRVVGGGTVIVEPDINFLDDKVITPIIDDSTDVLF